MNRAHLGAIVVALAVVPFAAAEAQEGLGAVVCVASELESMAGAGPVRRVIDTDTQVVYRIGVPVADQEEVEASLVAELAGSGGVRCVSSEQGQSHLVVVSYQGVVRQDETIDPEDPRYQLFSVGYGTSWPRAEQNATTVSGRFTTNYDGSGYEVIVREQWSAGGAAEALREKPPVAAGEELRAAAPAGVGAGGAGRRPGEVFRDCAACPELVVVPAGSFMMGSPTSEEGRWEAEGPRHRVTIRAPFAVGVYEVTFAEWDACVAAGGCGGYRPDDWGWGRGSRPVINVSWEDVREYVRWLSRETGEEYRLLTEAEWEYVARAGTQTARYWGERETGQCRYGNGYDRTGHAELEYDWVDPATCSDAYVRTAPVGLFEPNGFGLYDVLGNVWEWTQDCWNESYSGAPADGSAWSSGDCSQRVLRGGSWSYGPRFLRSANRYWFEAGSRLNVIGFRVARTMN